MEVAGDALIGADGIHSRARSLLYPHEGPPAWCGLMLWRGATEWPVYADGRTMVIAGGNAAKFVIYPIHLDPSRPPIRLTNWAVMARLGDGTVPPPRREDWNRTGRREEALCFVRDRFDLGFIDPVSLIEATDTLYEYPACDRDPLPRWSFGRITLLGDAAHPMYPVGSNGASQAILDAQGLGASSRLDECAGGIGGLRCRAPPVHGRDRPDEPQGRPGRRHRSRGGAGAGRVHRHRGGREPRRA
jgi:2-polyprenyl-6-methoxyphenol hydroxylase-like FAD-dependent oxidoreductase